MGDKTHIFLRDDDVGALDERLARFVDVFAARRLPVSYQVIPHALSGACADFLRQRRESAPDLIEFAQHGLTHEMMVGGKRVYYEFGPERTYQEQFDVIAAGQAMLADRLGEHFNPKVFTPPQHKYNRDTLRALSACGVEVLSASSYSKPAYRVAYGLGRALGLSSIGRAGISYHGRVRPDCGLFELSISVPVDDGSVHQSSAADVIRQIEQARRHSSSVGLMFHHNAYDPDVGARFLEELADRLLTVPDAEFHLLGALVGVLRQERT